MVALLLFEFDRTLAEDWLEHYRVAMGIASPHLKSVGTDPGQTKVKARAASAKSSPGGGGVVIIESLATQIPKARPSKRVPSAPGR